MFIALFLLNYLVKEVSEYSSLAIVDKKVDNTLKPQLMFEEREI